ncbi:hypothetical protein [Kitasatospora cathayae]
MAADAETDRYCAPCMDAVSQAMAQHIAPQARDPTDPFSRGAGRPVRRAVRPWYRDGARVARELACRASEGARPERLRMVKLRCSGPISTVGLRGRKGVDEPPMATSTT